MARHCRLQHAVGSSHQQTYAGGVEAVEVVEATEVVDVVGFGVKVCRVPF